MNKTAIILSNTGTPDDASVAAVRRYLKQFLGDKRVITMPAWLRKLLVNGIIVPFRAPRSARLYQKVWTEKGSPLLSYSQSLRQKLQQQLGDEFDVLLGMRYGNPSLESALQTVQQKNYPNLILAPLFPQYASSTTGSITELVHHTLHKWNNIPALKTIAPFFENERFIENVAENIRKNNPDNYQHILFSYHGLPLRHVRATHQGKDCTHFHCTKEMNHQNVFCYQAACYATTKLLARKLNLRESDYSVCFQSRFSTSWLSPFTDEVIVKKARQGVTSLLITSPSFVTDCLETIIELGDEYKSLFLENGGQEFQWVESLNDQTNWVSTLKHLILNDVK